MAANVKFEERDLLGGWSIAVLLNGAVVGNIRKSGTGYAYFKGPHNQLTWQFQDESLDAITARVHEMMLRG